LQLPEFRSFIRHKASQLTSGVRENASSVEAEQALWANRGRKSMILEVD